MRPKKNSKEARVWKEIILQIEEIEGIYSIYTIICEKIVHTKLGTNFLCAVMIEFERRIQLLYLVLAVVSPLDSPVVFVREWVFYRWSVSAEPLEGTVSQTPGASRGGRALLHPCALQVSPLTITDLRLCAHTQPRCMKKWCTVKKNPFWHWRRLHPHCNCCALTFQWDADQIRPLPGSECAAGAWAVVSGARQKRWSGQTLRGSKVSTFTYQAYTHYLCS